MPPAGRRIGAPGPEDPKSERWSPNSQERPQEQTMRDLETPENPLPLTHPAMILGLGTCAALYGLLLVLAASPLGPWLM
jgi:hypothetical protein